MLECSHPIFSAPIRLKPSHREWCRGNTKGSGVLSAVRQSHFWWHRLSIFASHIMLHRQFFLAALKCESIKTNEAPGLPTKKIPIPGATSFLSENNNVCLKIDLLGRMLKRILARVKTRRSSADWYVCILPRHMMFTLHAKTWKEYSTQTIQTVPQTWAFTSLSGAAAHYRRPHQLPCKCQRAQKKTPIK